MEISALNQISRHKFAKLLRSKFYWAFFLIGLGLLLITLIPILVADEFTGGGPEILFLISGFTMSYTYFGLFAAVTIGSIVLVQDVRDGTIFPYLAKPISRGTFVFGKILGAFKLMVVFWIFQVVYFLIFLYAASDYGITLNLVLAFIYDLLFYFMIVSVTAFFSVFIHPLWASMVVLAAYYLPFIAKFMIHTEWGFWTTLARIFYYIGPDFYVLNNWGNIIGSTMIYDTSHLQKLAYYITLLLLVLIPTFYIFTRRNLTPKD
jgi:ABC-type transport system involved in multi-copper enzyme maturation permease subunit